MYTPQEEEKAEKQQKQWRERKKRMEERNEKKTRSKPSSPSNFPFLLTISFKHHTCYSPVPSPWGDTGPAACSHEPASVLQLWVCQCMSLIPLCWTKWCYFAPVPARTMPRQLPASLLAETGSSGHLLCCGSWQSEKLYPLLITMRYTRIFQHQKKNT